MKLMRLLVTDESGSIGHSENGEGFSEGKLQKGRRARGHDPRNMA